MQSDAALVPIIVHRATLRVIDGMHRLRAARLRNQDEIGVQFFDGDEDEVFVLSVKLNTQHGLPLTRADRRAAATRIIRSHPQRSDRMIAAVAGLSPKTVGAIRRSSPAEPPTAEARIGRDGRSRLVDSAEGRRVTSEFVLANRSATLRQIADGGGVSVATAQDVRARIRRGESPQLPNPRDRRPPVTALPGTATGLEPFRTAAGILPALRRDPSVKFSDQGRLLLRILGTNALTPEQWGRLIDSVPSHCAALVSSMAREYAEGWRVVAERMQDPLVAPAAGTSAASVPQWTHAQRRAS